MNIIGFKIWTKDGVFQSDDWNELPDRDVLIVMVYYDEIYAPDCHYRKTIDGCDWYWFEDDDVHGVRSEAQGWQPKPDKPNVKQGVMVDDALFERVSREAMADKRYG